MAVDMKSHKASPTSRHPAAQKRKRADQSTSIELATSHDNPRSLPEILCLSSSDDTKLISTINTRYEVLLQSVISSSKIQQRVAAVLRHLTPPTQSPGMPTLKTRLFVLRAKATEAGKLISIAEIAKREIEKEQPTPTSEEGQRDGSQTGRWYQYIALGEELQQKRRRLDDTVIEGTMIGGRDTDADDFNEDDDFEVMKTPFERAIEGQPLVRGVPIMSLFLSRAPIEDLKKRYGEQTNATPMPVRPAALRHTIARSK